MVFMASLGATGGDWYPHGIVQSQSTGAVLVRRPAEEEPPVNPDSEDSPPADGPAGATASGRHGALTKIGNVRRLLRLHR